MDVLSGPELAAGQDRTSSSASVPPKRLVCPSASSRAGRSIRRQSGGVVPEFSCLPVAAGASQPCSRPFKPRPPPCLGASVEGCPCFSAGGQRKRIRGNLDLVSVLKRDDAVRDPLESDDVLISDGRGPGTEPERCGVQTAPSHIKDPGRGDGGSASANRSEQMGGFGKSASGSPAVVLADGGTSGFVPILLKNWKAGAVGHGRSVGACAGSGVVGAGVLSARPRASAGGPAWRAS